METKETREAWEVIGGDTRVKRIRQGGVYLYVFLDEGGAPVGSQWVPVREVEAPAEFRIDPEVFAAVSTGIAAVLETIRSRYVEQDGAQGPQEEGLPFVGDCPVCGVLEGVLFDVMRPTPGDVGRCAACGALVGVNEDGSLRRFAGGGPGPSAAPLDDDPEDPA